MNEYVNLLRSIERDEYTDDYPQTTAKRSADLIEALVELVDHPGREHSTYAFCRAQARVDRLLSSGGPSD